MNPPRIAVVDDDAAVCRALARLLRSAGFSVATFGSAEALLGAGAGERFACLLLDIQLGAPGPPAGLDSLELHRALGQLAPPRAPVVLMTGHDVAAARAVVEAPGVECLRKPFDGGELLAAIARATGGTRPPS